MAQLPGQEGFALPNPVSFEELVALGLKIDEAHCPTRQCQGYEAAVDALIVSNNRPGYAGTGVYRAATLLAEPVSAGQRGVERFSGEEEADALAGHVSCVGGNRSTHRSKRAVHGSRHPLGPRHRPPHHPSGAGLPGQPPGRLTALSEPSQRLVGCLRVLHRRGACPMQPPEAAAVVPLTARPHDGEAVSISMACPS